MIIPPNCGTVQGTLYADCLVPLYKVVVTFGVEESRITSKELHEQANIVFVNECGNAARVLATRPGESITVNLKLLKPTGEIEKEIIIIASQNK
jgi:hypothetical protein